MRTGSAWLVTGTVLIGTGIALSAAIAYMAMPYPSEDGREFNLTVDGRPVLVSVTNKSDVAEEDGNATRGVYFVPGDHAVLFAGDLNRWDVLNVCVHEMEHARLEDRGLSVGGQHRRIKADTVTEYVDAVRRHPGCLEVASQI